MKTDSHRAFTPKIPDPYPGAFETIDGFIYETRLVLAREPAAPGYSKDREACYVVAEPYTVSFEVDGVRKRLTVPKGMLTDLASVPQFARSLVGRVGPHLEAAIVHDFLFIAWQLLEGRKARRRDFTFANEVMFAGLRASGTPAHEALAIRVALKFPVISWGVYREREDGPIFIELDDRFAAVDTGLSTA